MPDYKKPLDFENFWEHNKLNCVPNLIIYNKILDKNGYSFEFKFNSFDNFVVTGHGYINNNSNKTILCLPGYMTSFKKENMLKYAKNNFNYFSIYFRNQITEEDKKSKTSLYHIGILEKNNFYLNLLIKDSMLLYNYLNKNYSNVSILGYSQGGGISLFLGYLFNIKKVVSIFPSFSNNYDRMSKALGSAKQLKSYIKNKPNNYNLVLKTLSYFDTIYLSEYIKNKYLVILSEKDDVCPISDFMPTYNNFYTKPILKTYKYKKHTEGKNIYINQIIKYLNQK